MDLTIPNEVAIPFIQRYGKPEWMDPIEDWDRWSKQKTLNSRLFERAQLASLRAIAMEISEAHKGAKFGKLARQLATDIQSYLTIEDDEDGSALCRSLKALPDAIIKLFESLPFRWMVNQSKDTFNPRYMVAGITAKYHEAVKQRGYYEPAYVSVSLKYWERGKVKDAHSTFKAGHLGRTVQQILFSDGLTIPTKEDMADYEEQLKRFDAWRNQLGNQFLTSGVGQIDGESNWRSKNTVQRLAVEGNPAKLVCDDTEAEDDQQERSEQRTLMIRTARDDHEEETGTEEAVQLPVNPLIRFFDLSRHEFYIVHVSDIEPYVYDEGLIEKLVMPAEHKALVGTLLRAAISTEGALGDIVRGKSGGTAIMCHGKAGTGKSLTAECFAECVKRPLYLVQCAQLGISVGEVEKELQLVLHRASRWKAVLLIDEADVYVMKRGSDMHQNAVIGTFLRVLEYFDGILFMTTNRGGDVDDAIRSRCIAEIEYGVPKKTADKADLWKILGANYGLALNTAMLGQLVTKFPHATGRDVKQLCRLVRINHGLKPTIKHFEALAGYKPGGFGEEA